MLLVLRVTQSKFLVAQVPRRLRVVYLLRIRTLICLTTSNSLRIFAHLCCFQCPRDSGIVLSACELPPDELRWTGPLEVLYFQIVWMVPLYPNYKSEVVLDDLVWESVREQNLLVTLVRDVDRTKVLLDFCAVLHQIRGVLWDQTRPLRAYRGLSEGDRRNVAAAINDLVRGDCPVVNLNERLIRILGNVGQKVVRVPEKQVLTRYQVEMRVRVSPICRRLQSLTE